MKKLINSSENCVDEMLEGFLAAYGNRYRRAASVRGFAVKEKKERVGILIGGGSGHEPLFSGFVGEGMADGVALGQVFASPDPGTILEVTRMVDAITEGILAFLPTRCLSGMYLPVPAFTESDTPVMSALCASNAALPSLRYFSVGEVSKSKETTPALPIYSSISAILRIVL